MISLHTKFLLGDYPGSASWCWFHQAAEEGPVGGGKESERRKEGPTWSCKNYLKVDLRFICSKPSIKHSHSLSYLILGYLVKQVLLFSI